MNEQKCIVVLPIESHGNKWFFDFCNHYNIERIDNDEYIGIESPYDKYYLCGDVHCDIVICIGTYDALYALLDVFYCCSDYYDNIKPLDD